MLRVLQTFHCQQPTHILVAKYHKRGKFHWAKHVGLQPYETFCRNTFAVPWPCSSVYCLTIAKCSRENFHGTLKNRKSLAQQIFPCLRHNYHYK